MEWISSVIPRFLSLKTTVFTCFLRQIFPASRIRMVAKPRKERGNVRTGTETTLLPAYGRRRMLALSEAYGELARSYRRMSENTIQENGKESDAVSRRDRFYNSKTMNHHLLMAENLQDMAESMRILANENITYHTPSRKKTTMIKNGLKKHGIFMHDMYLMERRGILQLVMTLHAGRDADFTTEDIAEVLSGFFHRSFLSAKENYFFVSYEPEVYVFEMQPPYQLKTGIATAVKESEKISGDNTFFYEISGSEQLCAISDGAGSGEEACAESEKVLEWLEKYVDSGFDALRAAELVNGYYLSLAKEQNMPTLDACLIDLESATAFFVKYGAPASYIRRGTNVEKISGGGYPLGFCLSKNRVMPTEYDLLEEDSIVMISDGVLECFEKEEEFLAALQGACGTDPKEAANYLMQCALHAGKGRVRDDITILFATLLPNLA